MLCIIQRHVCICSVSRSAYSINTHIQITLMPQMPVHTHIHSHAALNLEQLVSDMI